MTIFRLLLFVFTLSHCGERITSFVSTLTLKTDGNLIVKEEIEVISTLRQIRHGIIREIPTSYCGRWGLNRKVDFAILSIMCDGNLVPFKVKSADNGKLIYMGDENTLVAPGKHTYVIMYETNRQIGFFDDHDEIYWNVTGNGWDFIIDQAQVYVYLPEKIAPELITAEAYTGYYGARGNDYAASITKDHIFFKTTNPLYRSQGFTIVASFPKGIINTPSFYQQLWWFLKDNIWALLLYFCFLSLIILIFKGSNAAERKNTPGIIIPLFYPPENMTPSDVGYINKKRFYNTLLSADIINLAVKGFITLTYNPGRWSHGSYTVRRTNKLAELKKSSNMRVYDELLLATLFRKKDKVIDEITIEQKSNETLIATLEKCKKQTTGKYKDYIFSLNNYLYPIRILIFIILVLTFALDFSTLVCVAFFMFSGTFFPSFAQLFFVYTSEGRKLQDAIEGFKLYLKMAEVDRMRISGTPPTKTPKLYETYLPYAIALGVEEQWTEQFSSIFEQLEREGHIYQPRWYRGKGFKSHLFASELNKSFTTTISAASTAPGSSSGSGGRGYSGGGGGGGGGRGW